MKRLFKYALLLFSACCVGLGLAVMLPLKSAPLTGVARDYLISHVNIVSTTTGSVSVDMNVIISGGRIIKIVPGSDLQSASGFTEIPARHKFLIPGLWDMHTHSLQLSPQLHHPLFLRYGITAIRDMSGCLAETDSYWACPADRSLWETEAVQAQRVSPRYPLQSSYQTNGGNEVPDSFPDFFRLNTANDARELVDFYAGQGVDFIKTYSELNPEQYDNLSRHALAANISLSGHKPLTVSLRQALNTPMASIEHGRLFAFECFRGIESFRAMDNPLSHYDAQFMRELLDGQDEEKCAALMEAMASSSTSWVPTLTTLKMSAMANDTSFQQDKRLDSVPYLVRKLIWEPDLGRASGNGYDQQGRFVHAQFYEMAAEHVRKAHEAGVRVLAGTDNIDTWVFTGASLHDELAMLVDAGLSPLEALQAATLHPARFAQLENEFGTIEAGQRADLVLLNANPLVDIRNTSDIEGVMFEGQYFDPQALDTLEAYAIEMAQSFRVNLRLLFDMVSSAPMRAQLAD